MWGASAIRTELFQASTRKEGCPGRLGSVEMALTGGSDANIRHFQSESFVRHDLFVDIYSGTADKARSRDYTEQAAHDR
jgi:hypothetical protein